MSLNGFLNEINELKQDGKEAGSAHPAPQPLQWWSRCRCRYEDS